MVDAVVVSVDVNVVLPDVVPLVDIDVVRSPLPPHKDASPSHTFVTTNDSVVLSMSSFESITIETPSRIAFSSNLF